MSRWPLRTWWRPSACRWRRRTEFCCRRLKAGAAEQRATRLAVRRGFRTVIEADLEAFSPGRVAADCIGVRGGLAEGERAF